MSAFNHISKIQSIHYLKLYISRLCIPNVVLGFCALLQIMFLTCGFPFTSLFLVLSPFFGFSSFLFSCFGIVFNHWLVIIFGGKTVQNGAKLGHTGPNGANRVKPRQTGPKVGQTGSNEFKWIQTGPNGAKWGRTGPNGAKRGQTGPNGAKRG